MARESGALVHVVATEDRLDRVARLLWALAPDVVTMLFPPWDCLPYDRTSPSAGVMGVRTATLSSLAAGCERPWIVLATAEALAQRLPPRTVWPSATFHVAIGGTLGLDTLASRLKAIGYREDDRVDEPGEFAVRGHVVDIFPAGYYLPVRIEHDADAITRISSYEAATQRRTDAFTDLVLRPVSEAVTSGEHQEGVARSPGIEHRLPELYPELETMFDYVSDATFTFEPGATVRGAAFLEQVQDAYDTRIQLRRGEGRPPAPDRLYLGGDERSERLDRHATLMFADAEERQEVPDLALDAHPNAALATFVGSRLSRRQTVVLAAGSDAELRRLTRPVARELGREADTVPGWLEVMAARPGSLLSLGLELDQGFVSPDGRVVAISVADLLGSRATARATARVDIAALAEERFAIGDAVIHLDHGVGVLEGLETVSVGPAGPTDTMRFTFAGEAKLLAPVADIDRIWRYGAVSKGIRLDKLDGDAWPKRRAKVEADLNRAAAELARITSERAERGAAKLVPPRREFERFVARFPFSETPDQRNAVADILRDLTAGQAMNRLVCGDVGFGKTEVALRAAAAVALAGKQVAVVAPTTVLVRQHLQTFRRRFADLGIEIGHLSRLVKPAEAHITKEGLADGRIRIVIGTQALAADGVGFSDLGLLIIDEEQHFGAAHKDKLKALGQNVHVLTLSATPIPRTLQSAMAGLQEVSVLATPPAERLPVRTTVAEFDDATVREALIREQRRGGQSFVVCPQIEDIAPLSEQLKRLVPELDIFVAHGKLPVDEIDDTMVRFADGQGDVLLATNIIESGLDVPRANTIMVWRADRFGLSQLHQLRGRVGRGRLRGAAYFLTEAGTEVAPATRKRLETLSRFDRLGAGFAISGEDLDQRGAGDLLGESQAGHLKLIGAGLYRRLLERALIAARGGKPPEEWSPELNIGLGGRLPEDYVPEPELRINLYARIARITSSGEEARLAEEMEDRFGPPPAEIDHLLALARLRRLCRAADVARVDAGPQAIALTFKTRGEADPRIAAMLERGAGDLAWRERRLILKHAIEDADERLSEIEALLQELARPATERGDFSADKVRRMA